MHPSLGPVTLPLWGDTSGRVQTLSVDRLAWLSAEIMRHSNVVGALVNDATVTRLINALMLEQHVERECECADGPKRLPQ